MYKYKPGTAILIANRTVRCEITNCKLWDAGHNYDKTVMILRVETNVEMKQRGASICCYICLVDDGRIRPYHPEFLEKLSVVIYSPPSLD